MANKKSIYMIGPSLKTQGGISSVLSIYWDNFSDSLNLGFISSYSGKNRVMDFWFFACAVMKVILANITSGEPVFHIHVASMGSYLRKSILAKICLRFKHKVIFHIHGAMFDKFIEDSSPRKKDRIIKMLNRVERVVVLSQSWYEFFSKYVPKEKLLIIYNPSSTFKPGLIKKINKGRQRLLFMGRMGERKGSYDLIAAVKKIKGGNFILNMYGDGDIDKVKDLVAKENLNGQVTVNTWVDYSQIGKIYDNSDIMVLPSYAEGLPMSLLEAIGKGLPIVSTKIGGIPEAVIEGRNGFLITPGDVDTLADRLEFLINSPDMVEKFGKESLEIAKEKFSIDEIGSKLKKLYATL